MGRRAKPKFTADGILVVNKPEGPTSHDVVAKLRRRFKPAKLGHAGTLDPFSTGVLVLAFNRATRLTGLLGGGEKNYRAGLVLGKATDTGDYTGQVVEEIPVPELDAEKVMRALGGLEGPGMQAPPAYSAAKHQGKPLYAYARKGIKVEKPPRPITVYRARLLGLDEGRVDFAMRVSAGTYIRCLGEDLAKALGTAGHLNSLCRTESEPFGLEEAVGLEEALDMTPEELEQALVPPSEALERCGLPAVELDEDRAWELRQGRILEGHTLQAAASGPLTGGTAFRVITAGGELVAVLRWLAPEEAKPGRDYETIRVFPETGSPGNVLEEFVSANEAE